MTTRCTLTSLAAMIVTRSCDFRLGVEPSWLVAVARSVEGSVQPHCAEAVILQGSAVLTTLHALDGFRLERSVIKQV
jgi:hypothetical protein